MNAWFPLAHPSLNGSITGKIVVALALILPVNHALHSQTLSKNTTLQGFSHSISLGPGTVNGFNAFYTTFDGSTGFPLFENFGNSPFFSRELLPTTLGGDKYATDYVTYNPQGEAVEYGTFELNLPIGDANFNGIPDVLEINQTGAASFSGRGSTHWQSTIPFNVTGVLNRNPGSATGTYSFRFASAGGNVTYLGDYQIPFWTGSMAYTRGETNKLTWNLTFHRATGPQVNFIGTSEFFVLSANNWITLETTLTNQTTLDVIGLNATSFQRTGKIYRSQIQISDGEPITEWSDYTRHVFEIEDPFDGDLDGIPDLTDDFIAPPNITQQPLDQVVNFGQPLQFAVQVEETAFPVTYQWRFNGSPLPGATLNTYTIPNVQPQHLGDYSVLVTNAGGSVLSEVVQILIRQPPTLLSQPQNQTINFGANANFSVTVGGTAPFTFEWTFNGDILANQNQATLHLPRPQPAQSGEYRVRVTNPAGSVLSDIATLTVYLPPTILTGPQSKTLSPGSELSLSVLASGSSPLSYQWFINQEEIPFATGSSIVIENAQPFNSGNYSVQVSNPGGSVTSPPATVIIAGPPTIVTGLSSKTIQIGNDTFFSIEVEGTPPLTYDWLFNETSLGAPSLPLLTLSNVQPNQSGPYRVRISNAAGSVLSAPATLTVQLPPTITQHPRSQFINPGETATLTVTATGTAPLTYEWFFNGVALEGNNQASLLILNMGTQNEGSYHVRVSNVAGEQESNFATLTLRKPPEILEQPIGQIVSIGGTIQLTVQVTGTLPITYEWRRNGVSLGQQTLPGFNLPNATPDHSGTYQVFISNAAGNIASNPVNVVVANPPEISFHPQNQSAQVGSSVFFQAIATGTPPLTYQWSHNDTPIPDATNNVLFISEVQTQDAGEYRLTVTNPAGSVTSNPATLQVIQPLLSARKTPDNQLELQLRGQPGTTYLIETTTNLIDWVEDTTLESVSPLETLLRPLQATQRFYRATPQP